MPKIKYYFDSKTLTFKHFKPELKNRLKKSGTFILLSVVSAVVMHFAYTSIFDTPKYESLEREKSEIISEYEILQSKLTKSNETLTHIEHRDDHVYRSIFELEPIPTTVRKAGYGGAVTYSELEGYNSSDIMIETFTMLDQLSKKLYVQSKSFDNVVKLALNKEEMVASIPGIQPIAIKDFRRITDYYGMRSDPFTGKPTMHHGMDFKGPTGSPIYATGNGTVINAGYNLYGYGNKVVIDHGFGYTTIYAHLKDVHVKKGDKVKRGDIIGTLGNTGRSTGAHLHYEVRKNNITKDPMNYYFDDITAEQYEEMIAISRTNRQPMD